MSTIVKDRVVTEPGDNTVEIGVIKVISVEWLDDDAIEHKGWQVSVFNHGDDPEPLCQFKVVGEKLFSLLEENGWYGRSDGKLAGQLRYSFYRRIWQKSSLPLYCPMTPLPQYVDVVAGDERCDW